MIDAPPFAETITWLEKLAAASPFVNTITFGKPLRGVLFALSSPTLMA
jgi:hypothetical protein